MQMQRRPKSKKSNHYFTKDHENAIIDYCSTGCNKKKTEIYVKMLQPAFGEMVDKIVFTYKFTTLPNIYFSVITKNWFIHKVKKQKRKNMREVDYDAAPKRYEQEYLATEHTWVSDQLQKEFWTSFYEDMKTWESNDMRENDERVYKAIIVLFESKEDIEIFNKKAIYLYLREITGLNTKQVVNSLNKFREHYRDFRSDWENGKI